MARTIILSACFLTGCFLCGCQAAAPASPPNMFEPSSSLLPPLATTTPTAKRPAEPQPTLTPREAPVEFFVDGSSPAASDANPGSAEKPFKTINRGLKELRPGDALTVQGGTYREAFRVKIVASAEHPVVLRAAPGQTVVIKGSELVKGWVKDGNVWKKEGWTQEYVQKTFDKGEGASADPMAVYQKDGVHGEGVVLFRVRTPEELRAGKCYWDEKTGTITIYPAWSKEPFDPNQDGVEVPVRGFGMSIEGRYVNASGFQIRQITSGNGIGGWHNRIEDCVYTWSGNCGTYVGGFYTTVRRCETSYCGCTGMGGCGEEILIEDCVVTHNNVWRYNPGWHGGGAKFIPGFNHSVIRGCQFSENYGPGLWFDCSCMDNIVENNNCNDNEGCGIGIEISRNNILRNNICNFNRAPLPGVDIVPTETSGISPVKCQQLRQEAGRGGTGIGISSSPYCKVYNNLCYGNQGEGIDVEGGRRGTDDMTDYADGKRVTVYVSSHDVDIRDNILVNNGGQQLRLARNGRDADTFGNRSDYNMFYSADDRPLVRWGFGGTVFQTLEQWQKESGDDLHSVVGAPTCEFSPGLDFRLQPDSVGVGQGQTLPEVPADILGAPRPEGKACMGPYQIAAMGRTLLKPKIPENLTWFQVDLGKLVNREFADPKAGDGVGWTNQGPDCDLAKFPTGRQTFNGVPFNILSPKGCVVLHGNPWHPTEKLPLRVVIPVHRKADMLVFLHGGAWVWNGQVDWRYIIHRGDGTQEEIKMIGGENIRDWANPNADVPFHREFPTTSKVAWSGANKTFERVSVYMMTWVNQNTWVDITEIEMIAPDNDVPILIGITGGTKK